MDYPFYGDLCSSQDDIKKENCDVHKQAAMGGEPGAMEQYESYFKYDTMTQIPKHLIIILGPLECITFEWFPIPIENEQK